MCVCIHMYVYTVKIYVYIYMYTSWQAGIIPQTLGDPFSPCSSKKFIQPLFFLTNMSAIALKQEIQDLLDNVEDAGICPGDKWVASPWSVPALLTRLFKRRRMGSTAIRPSSLDQNSCSSCHFCLSGTYADSVLSASWGISDQPSC